MFGFTKNKEEKTNIPLAPSELTDKIISFIERNKASIILSVRNNIIYIDKFQYPPIYNIFLIKLFTINHNEYLPKIKKGEKCGVLYEGNEYNPLFTFEEKDYLAIKEKVEHIIQEKVELSKRTDQQIFYDMLDSTI